LTVIIGLAEEMREAWGDCPATKAYQEQLLQEAGLVEAPPKRDLDDLLDEIEGNEGE
jgi:hypothetical protein